MPPPAPPKGGGGLAIAALVLAVIALLLCWIPIVNNLAFVLGLLALALGGIAWFRSRGGRRAGRGPAVAAAVVSVVAMVGVIATQAFFGQVLDEISGTVSEASDDADEPADTPKAPKVAAADSAEEEEAVAVDAVATQDTEDAPAEDSPEADDKSSDSDGLPLGTSAEIGDYTVTVSDVQLDANEAVLAANSFNEDPQGQYVLVTLDVTYTGDEQGDPWVDLSIELAGSDNRIYDSSSCEAVAPNHAMDVPTLTAGGSGTFSECFDVPVEALDNPTVRVENWLSFGGKTITWRTDERVEGGEHAGAEENTPVAPDSTDAHEIGESAEVGDYSVTVTDVQLDANDAVQSANTFNDAPSGQYVLATLEVTYTGDEEGDAWLDLGVQLAGSDARIYDSSSCMAVTPNPVIDVPTLTNGGKGSFDICFDVPVDALEGPVLYVEESFSFDDARAAWKTTS